MGYTTDFFGEVTITPPLNQIEIQYLNDFSNSRRMNRGNGPYYAFPNQNGGQNKDPDIKDYNTPPKGQPSLWCQWVPNKNGTAIEWDGGEKFQAGEEWMVYLIEHFLKENAYAKCLVPEQFDQFQNHELNGTIYAKGEDDSDIWRIVVDKNKVYVHAGIYNSNNNEYFEASSIEWDDVQWASPREIVYTPTHDELAAPARKESRDINKSIEKIEKANKPFKL